MHDYYIESDYFTDKAISNIVSIIIVEDTPSKRNSIFKIILEKYSNQNIKISAPKNLKELDVAIQYLVKNKSNSFFILDYNLDEWLTNQNMEILHTNGLSEIKHGQNIKSILSKLNIESEVITNHPNAKRNLYDVTYDWTESVIIQLIGESKIKEREFIDSIVDYDYIYTVQLTHKPDHTSSDADFLFFLRFILDIHNYRSKLFILYNYRYRVYQGVNLSNDIYPYISFAIKMNDEKNRIVKLLHNRMQIDFNNNMIDKIPKLINYWDNNSLVRHLLSVVTSYNYLSLFKGFETFDKFTDLVKYNFNTKWSAFYLMYNHMMDMGLPKNKIDEKMKYFFPSYMKIQQLFNCVVTEILNGSSAVISLESTLKPNDVSIMEIEVEDLGAGNDYEGFEFYYLIYKSYSIISSRIIPKCYTIPL